MEDKIKWVVMPDGGHCCLNMCNECYGCYYYGTGDITGCQKRIDTYYNDNSKEQSLQETYTEQS